MGGALGAFAGGKAAEIGGHTKAPVEKPEAKVHPEHPTSTPATGEGPAVQFEHPPDVVLPLRDPSEPIPQGTDIGTVEQHRKQKPRGTQQISEHVMPGSQWEAITTDPLTGKSSYENQGRHYENDYTVRVEKDLADLKTHEGTNSDNRRTQQIKDKIATGERIDVIEDVFLPSIEKTKSARDASNSSLKDEDITWGAMEQLGHKFDLGTGEGRYGRRNRDRRAELRQVGKHLEPHGGVADINWDATFPPSLENASSSTSVGSSETDSKASTFTPSQTASPTSTSDISKALKWTPKTGQGVKL
jgi:hypothetical protein